ncbi:MAG TPA: hypothetical protein VJ927_10975 [Actinomycetota bacterium]|nr:hypothetical protein [Actinomycetota bacterium]
MKTQLVAGLLVLALGACGSATEDPTVSTVPGDGSSGDTGPDAPVTAAPAPGGDLGGGRPQRVRPRPGMDEVRPVGWENARLTPNGRSLRITYWSGVEPCNVLDRVDLRYGDEEVAVTLFEGYDPDARDVACIEVALRKVVVVALEEPLGGRRITDGAR